MQPFIALGGNKLPKMLETIFTSMNGEVRIPIWPLTDVKHFRYFQTNSTHVPCVSRDIRNLGHQHLVGVESCGSPSVCSRN